MSKSNSLQTLNDDFSQLEPYSRCAEIQDLPNEILQHIFGFLNIRERVRTESVCTRWRDIGKNVMWDYPTKLDFTDIVKLKLEHVSITDDVVSAILSRCGRNVRQAKVSMIYYKAGKCEQKLTNKVLDIIGDNCPNLVEVRLEGSSTEKEFATYLINLSRKCTKLKKVFIGSSPTLNDAILRTFLKHCRSVEYFRLEGNTVVTVNFIDSLKMDLKGLYLYTPRLSLEDVVKKLTKICDRIVEFDITGLSVRFPITTLKKFLCYYSSTLKNLCLRRYAMKQSKWYCIPDMIRQLEVLSLREAAGVDDHLMKLLAKKCKQLRSLNLLGTAITDVGAAALASAPSLTDLSLGFTRVTGKGILALATQGRLEKLYFANHIGTRRRKLVEGVISLAKCCPNLGVLILGGNGNITNLLVAEFNSSLESGILKGPVSLYVPETNVKTNVYCCHKLRLFFSFTEIDSFSDELSFIR